MKFLIDASSLLPIHARSLEERPLGGTETGVIRVAEELQQKGHQVTVLTSHPTPSLSSPLYLSTTRPSPALEQCAHSTYDLHIAVRSWRALFRPIRARARILWTGDPHYQFNSYGIGDPRVSRIIDALFVVSHWHGETLSARSGFPPEKVCIVGNGVHLPYFPSPLPFSSRPPRLVYASAPNRGLDLALKLFQRVREIVPAAELAVCSGYSIYDTDRPYAGPEVQSFRQLSHQMARMPGVLPLGNVDQATLAETLSSARALFYPNTMPESCCIVAMEALAAGTPVLTSDLGALPEVVGDGGECIGGGPGSEQFCRDFIGRAVALLSDEGLWTRYSTTGRIAIERSGSWSHVAERFEQACRALANEADATLEQVTVPSQPHAE